MTNPLILNGWNRDYIVSAQAVDRYTDIILNNLKTTITSDDGATTFKGCPFTRMVSEIRYAGMKLPGLWIDQSDLFEKLGFKVVKGRPKWNFRDGKYQKECYVITL